MRLEIPCQRINFRTKDLIGKQFELSDLSGKRIALPFFATQPAHSAIIKFMT
jgi:hypothetical protein